jgi:ATP-dependent Clp protease ATP-binding subunit ClpC
MASMAHSLTVPSVGASPVGQLQGGAKSKRRSAARAALVGRKNVQAESASLSISPFQSFAGMRKASAVDCLGVKQGKDFRSVVAKSTAVSKQSGASRAVTTAMFERFTEKAIKVIMLAQEEARRLGHNFVGTEQILLGLIGEGTGIAAKVLKSMGVNLKEARVEVEKIIGRGSGFVAVEIPFTPRAKRVLELSLEEARQLGTCSDFWFRGT